MTTQVPVVPQAPLTARPRLPGALVQYGGMAAALIALIIIFGLASPSFATAKTAASIANQIPDLTVVAVGMTLVLIVGGIDLSVGSLLALSAAVMGVALTKWGWPLATAIPLALLVGASAGLVNGTISVWARIPSFIVTLGMLEAAQQPADGEHRYGIGRGADAGHAHRLGVGADGDQVATEHRARQHHLTDDHHHQRGEHCG